MDTGEGYPMKTQENSALPVIKQAELNEIIRKHQMFLTAKPGGARAVIRDRDLTGLSFMGQNLSQSDFTGCIMEGTDLTNANFESATLFGCDLTNAKLANTRLMRADMRGAAVGEADLSKADLTGADLREGKSIIKRKVKNADDIGAKSAEAGIVHFNGSDLTEAVLTGATAASADFSDAVLENAKMQGADLKGAVLKGADLKNVDLSGSDLRNADFSYATMTGAVLKDTEKGGSNFTLTLTGEPVGQDIAEIEMTLDELVLRHIHWVATAGRNGKQMVMQETDMRKAGSLSAKKLTAIRANRCTFAEMDLRGIEMQGANLDESDFRKCLIGSGDLRGGSFRGCILNRADFSKSDLNPLTIKRADGGSYTLPCRFDKAALRHAIFAGARLMEASFAGADLTNADFNTCDLRKADFTGAVLDGTVFDGAILDEAVFDKKES